jgi:hypothetical protein
VVWHRRDCSLGTWLSAARLIDYTLAIESCWRSRRWLPQIQHMSASQACLSTTCAGKLAWHCAPLCGPSRFPAKDSAGFCLCAFKKLPDMQFASCWPGEKLLVNKKHRELLQSYDDREAAVVAFLKAVRPSIKVMPGKLDDPKVRQPSPSGCLRLMAFPLTLTV